MESLGFELAPSKSKPISLTHIYRLLVVGDGPSKPIYLIISSSPFTTPSLYHSRFHLCQNPSNVQDLFPTYPLLAHWIPSGWIESATHCASKTSSSSYKTCKNSAMASVSCTSTSINLSPTSFNSRPPLKLGSQFLGLQSNLRWVSPIAIGPSNGSRATCWFNLRQNAEGAGIYGSQSRDDFIRDDVEQVLLSYCSVDFCFLFFSFIAVLGLFLMIWKFKLFFTPPVLPCS